MTKAYQRRFLRAPYFKDVIFKDKGHVFKVPALNISEGGILVTSMGYFPKEEKVHFMAMIPELPLFKNYDLEKILKYNPNHFESKVIRFCGEAVRKEEIPTEAENHIFTQIGFRFIDVKEFDQSKISDYIKKMTSNIVHLLVLFDTIADDESNLIKLRSIASYLGYNGNQKISILRKEVEVAYRSLQWL